MSSAEPGTDRDPAALLQSLEPLSRDLTDRYLEHHGVLPLQIEEGRLLVATWRDEIDPQALDDLRQLAGAPVELIQLPEQRA